MWSESILTDIFDAILSPYITSLILITKVFFINTRSINYNMQIEILLLKYILQKIDGPARFYKKNIL